jgi:hypothetical protein
VDAAPSGQQQQPTFSGFFEMALKARPHPSRLMEGPEIDFAMVPRGPSATGRTPASLSGGGSSIHGFRPPVYTTLLVGRATTMAEQSIVTLLVALIGAFASVTVAFITTRAKTADNRPPFQSEPVIQTEVNEKLPPTDGRAPTTTRAKKIGRWIILAVLYSVGFLYSLGGVFDMVERREVAVATSITIALGIPIISFAYIFQRWTKAP